MHASEDVFIPKALRDLTEKMVIPVDVGLYFSNNKSFPGTTPLELLQERDPLKLAENVAKVAGHIFDIMCDCNALRDGDPSVDQIIRDTMHEIQNRGVAV